MPAPSPEVQSKIAILRAKALEGSLTREDMQEAIELMRADRKGAAIASATSKAKSAKTAVPNVADLLDEIGGL